KMDSVPLHNSDHPPARRTKVDIHPTCSCVPARVARPQVSRPLLLDSTFGLSAANNLTVARRGRPGTSHSLWPMDVQPPGNVRQRRHVGGIVVSDGGNR